MIINSSQLLVKNMSLCTGVITRTGTGTGTRITRTRITGGEATVEVGLEVSVNIIVAGTRIIIIEAGAGLEAEAVVEVLGIAENVEEANMKMMRGVDEVGLMEGIVLIYIIIDVYELHYLLLCDMISDYAFGVCDSPSPARRSPSPRRSLSPNKTPPSGGGSPDTHNIKERSPTPKSVSPHGRRDSRSPSPRSEADVSNRSFSHILLDIELFFTVVCWIFVFFFSGIKEWNVA